MNKDQVKGESKIIAGKVQEGFGKLVGSEEQQLKGQGKQIVGETQKGIGNAQQQADDAADELNSMINKDR